MKKLMLAGILLAGIMTVNGQTTVNNTNITSGGSASGTIGTKATNYGVNAGKSVVTNTNPEKIAGNTLIGYNSGGLLTTGKNNTFTGYNSGSNFGCTQVQSACLTTGDENSFYGFSSGNANNGGNNNAFFGANAGAKNTSGSNNTYLGYSAGSNNKGSGNVFIGSNCGPTANQLGSSLNNILFIDNSINSNPLIWGDFANDQLKMHGKVGIGGNTATNFGSLPTQIIATPTNINISNYSLFVKGGILAEEVRVALSIAWADYVFEDNYILKPLSEVESFINENGHLPNVPSAAQVQQEGINVAEMARIQQEKIEELTLYIIELNKKLEILEAKMDNK